MDNVNSIYDALKELVSNIVDFQENTEHLVIFKAPVIDHFHPDDYSQRGIQGLRKFLGHVKSELQYVEGLVNSEISPKEVTTNAPNLIAVWEEFARAKPPLVLIAQTLETKYGQVKVDVVADGGNEWIKVNTIKQSRLLAEFREQDSYINSDYETDDDEPLTNSLIAQASALVKAARTFPRPPGQSIPRITYVLNRMEGDYEDSRIPRTFKIIEEMGVTIQLGHTTAHHFSLEHPVLHPTQNIIIDLSVLVALCCESSHRPLPTSEEDLQARFRPLQKTPSGLSLAPHTNVSKDLCDQLRWEMQHPLIAELLERLPDEPAFWITQEVKDRLPQLVDIIGGESERQRGQALFGKGDFFQDSRWKNNPGVLGDIKVHVLDEIYGSQEISDFQKGIIGACEGILHIQDTPIPPLTKKSNSKRNPTPLVTSNRLPTGHTLRTLIAGASRNWTVLTNNRGAVGKVCREMKVHDGLPIKPDGNDAAIWVVNPSSLSEWRRKEVERCNLHLRSKGDLVDLMREGNI